MNFDIERARILTALVNGGRFGFEEAERKIGQSSLEIEIGPEAAVTLAGQAAALTAVATACRCFGEVHIRGAVNVPLLVPVPIGSTLLEAATRCGAKQGFVTEASRKVWIGLSEHGAEPWSVRAYWNGWISGVLPGGDIRRDGRGDCALSGIAAGALAVGQAFLAEQGSVGAGRAAQTISLWNPERGGNSHPEDSGAKEVYLPAALWLIGLGNLGQAFLWALSCLPYRVPRDLRLFLQDDETIDAENWGTSILVERGRYGILKTRLAEEWAEARGFTVRRIDRKLDEHLRRTDSEPGIALAGLDKIAARRLLGLPGFEFVIDAGLGASVHDYSQLRVNVFDRLSDPAIHFQGQEDRSAAAAAELLALPAYKSLAEVSNDGGCGATLLAGKSVAVPFVSQVAAALTIAQSIRIASGQAHHLSIAGDTGDLRSVRASLGQQPERQRVGFAECARPIPNCM